MDKEVKPEFLNERVRKARLQKGMNQTRLAQATFFASSTISGIEKGTIYPSDRAIRLIAQAVGKKTEYFFDKNIPEDEGEVESGSGAGVYMAEATSSTTTEVTSPEDATVKWLEACRALVELGRYSEALALLGNFERVQKDLSMTQLRAAQFIQVQVLNRTNQTKAARDVLRNLSETIRNIPLPAPAPTLAQVLFELGAGYALEHQYDLAIENYQASLEVLGQKADQHPLGFKLYAELGRNLRQTGDLSQAEKFYEKAQQHQAIEKDERVLAQLLLSEGLKLVEQKRFAEAQEKLAQSARLYEKFDRIEQAASVNSYLKVVRAELKEFDKLEEEEGPNQLELDIPENYSISTRLILMTNRIAVLRLRDEEEALQEATRLLEEAIKTLEANQARLRPQTASQVYHEAARVWLKCQRQDEAIRAFDQALESLRQGDENRWSLFEKIYDDYEQALLEWDNPQQMASMLRQRVQDKKRLQTK